MLRIAGAAAAAPAALLAALIAAAEALAATDTTPGPDRLWSAEDGAALADLLAEAIDVLPALPDTTPDTLSPLLDSLLEGTVVRTRRATHAQPDGTIPQEHPRIAIWGLLEARLQSADLIVLGGLTEGVWPAATDPGPWMSRPMRARAGLPSAEARIGRAAQDFSMAACAAPICVLSAPRRRDGAPRRALPLAHPPRRAARPRRSAAPPGRGLGVPARPAPIRRRPRHPPRPRPPLATRPRRLSVTEIATLVADPYAVYARHILHLRPLDALEQSADFRDYGTIVHQGLDRFLRQIGPTWPEGAAESLAASLQHALRVAGIREALIAWWSPRLHRIAAWVDAEERSRRATHPLSAIAPEADGSWTLTRPGGPFTLTGRADRIERRADGGIAILDYKTGTLPNKIAAQDGREPQLLLEAAMVQDGAFGSTLRGPVRALTYWRLTGDHKQGESLTVLESDADGITIAAEDATDHLAALIDCYDNPDTLYHPQPGGGRFHRPYAQLSRAAEWASAEDPDADPTEPADQ